MLGLYIHIPFCDKKCYYCDFTSYISSENLMYDYVCAVIKELEMYRCEKFDTIFIGGGTPSYLSNDCMKKLLIGINKVVKNSVILEFTIECNPGTLSREKLEIMYSYGVNRLSIGVQSANEKTLKFIGRNHRFIDFDKSFNLAVNVGFNNISADLIFGIPCEKNEDYVNTIDVIKNYDLTHISAYNLILEKGTKFYKMHEIGMFEEMDEELQLAMYEYTKQKLEELGFKQYEISNYAKKNKKCLHNLIYWNFNSYIGIGVSAHSFYYGKRFENTKDVKKYIEMIKTDRHRYINIYTNKEVDNIQEYIMLGFRKNEGINMKDFKERFNVDFFDVYNKNIEKYVRNNLMEFKQDSIFLTSKGLILMNYIISEFIF